jgi:hypothetical protein
MSTRPQARHCVSLAAWIFRWVGSMDSREMETAPREWSRLPLTAATPSVRGRR